jgi:transposase
MPVERMDMHRLQDLVRLHRLGVGARTVARRLRMSPNTERQYRRALAAHGLLAGDATALPELTTLREAVVAALPPKTPPQQVSSLARWTGTITPWLVGGATPTAIYDRLRLEHADFTGSLSAVKRLCLRLQRARGIQPEDVAIPVETAPGELAQVDFGYVGRLYDPDTRVLRKAWVFVLVLGYSRHLVCRLVFDQRIETWLQCHAEAFAALGGVPAVLVPDNLKAAVIRAAFGIAGTTTLNRSYRECARHYGFQVDPTPIRSPEKKGRSRRP